jgi:RNA polymerase sigma-70 factor (ECF subfamily)
MVRPGDFPFWRIPIYRSDLVSDGAWNREARGLAFDRRLAVQGVAARLYGYAMSLCADPTLAEDLAQEAIAKAIAAEHAPTDPPAFRAWIFKILRNTFIDNMRRNGRLVGLDSDDMADCVDAQRGDGPEIHDDSVFNALTVRFALAKLPAPLREIVGLVDIAGFSCAEAAEMLGVPTGTVMSRLSRARAALAKSIVDTNVVPLPRRAKRSS